ncbi:MAG: S8 family serine peptidase [Phycisphaerales bacterium]
MTNPTRSHLARTATAATIVALSGLCSSALAAPQSGNANSPSDTQQSTLSASAKLAAVSAVLALEPGDEALMAQALSNPLKFTEKAQSQEFTRELIVHANTGKSQAAQARITPSIVKSSEFMSEYVVKVPAGVSEGEMAAMLMATGDYLFVEPNWTLFPAVIPNDPLYGSSWQHTRLQSAAAWDIHTGTSDIIVAVCDSGVDIDHPDLRDAYVPGYNAVNNRAEADGGLISDVNGHGSFVSGCAAAQGNNGTGVTGVGWDFGVMPIRVSNNSAGTANAFDLLEGSRWAVDNGARIVNVSFSGGSSSGNQSTANYVISRGGLLFWSSGNDNTFVTFDAPDLILVGSTTSGDNRSGFSNFGTAVDLTAPGSGVRSTNRFGGYNTSSGTSYASPIAAGVGAMIFSANPALSGWDAQDVLYNSVDDLGAPGRDDAFGRGRVNTLKAVQLAQTYVPRLELPIDETFDSASWMDLFSATVGSPSTVVDGEASGSVLMLSSSDQVTTVKLAGSSLPLIPTLSYRFKAEGVEAGEQFTIEMSNEDGSWESIVEYTSTGVDSDGYIDVQTLLPVSFRRHGVELRITAIGNDSSDQWFFEDFRVGDFDATPTVPLADSFEAGLFTLSAWDDNTGATVENIGTTYAAAFNGEQTLESIDVTMAQFGFVPAFIRVDASSDGSAGADDSIDVQVRDVIGNWVSVGTITGDTLSSSPETIQFQSPITAWATDTLRVRLVSSSNDPIFIDNVYVGPDELTSMCSPADFAEPFGQLNFLDVSAFLGAFGASDSSADIDNSGSFNFLDVSAFLTAFGQGCP